MEHGKDAAIIVFVKEPRPRFVKTRLASSLPDGWPDPESFATRVYEVCLEVIFTTLGALPYPVLVYVSPESSATYFKRFSGIEKISVQYGEDLGARMHNAFMQGFAQYDKLVLIGSDVPHLSTLTLEAALKALGNHDSVIGPAEDGGYYLIGFTRGSFQNCFSNIAWSTDTVFEQTMQRLVGRQTAILELYRDIDTVSDLRTVAGLAGCPPKLLDLLHTTKFC